MRTVWPGDIIRIKHALVIEPHGLASFKMPRGRRLVLLVLGDEEDGGPELDPQTRLKELGWVPNGEERGS